MLLQTPEGSIACPSIGCGEGIEPGVTTQPFVEDAVEAGALLQIPVSRAEDLSLSARLLELSRRSQPTGVEVPLIPEDQFLTGESHILAVPNTTEIRTSLRVYDPGSSDDVRIAVEVITLEGELITSTTLEPKVTAPWILESGHFVPGFAVIHDLASVLQIPEDVEAYTIRLVPEDERPYWAMASTTHDDTQHVLIISAN